MRHLTTSQTHELEALIDATTLGGVLEALTEICYGKASHLAGNWQEESAAEKWTRMGNRIDTQSSKAREYGL